MDAEPILRAGQRLDRYELLCPIASGGMAAVWLAQLRGKRGFEKLFAIKTIKTELTDDARFQEMFLDEARIASGIEHPNVAHIVDLGEQGSILYIAMEWVDGESLAKIARLARKRGTPLPLALALRITADACAGLHAAHELKDAKGDNLGVVHRDVSPQNILVTSSGGVKVIDFGVAKARNRRAGETGEGVVKGKIRYMAPEQVRNQDVDRRADVWAIGVCLQELTTGKVPFESESDIGVLRRLMSDEPPPPVSDDVPGPVRDILAKSIARDPAERFQTAAAMRRAIESAIVKLGLEAASDDVADFLRAELPELEAKRREVVTKALGAIDARASLSGESTAGADEVAFAPTVVSKGKDDTAAVPLTRKTPQGPSARAVLSGEVTPEDSKVTRTSFADQEVAGLPKNRGIYVVLAVLGLGAVAWFGWPGAARLREMAGHRQATPATLAPEPIPSASSSVPTANTTATASATPSASASTAPSASAAPLPSTATPTATPTSTPTSTATATATARPSATSVVVSPPVVPTTTAAPIDTTDDPY